MKLLPMAALCFLLGTAGGWHTRSAPSEAPTAAEPPRVSPRQARARQRSQKAGVPADVAARLAPIFAAKTPAERLRATIHLARTIPVSELARWYDNKWFDSRKDADANVFSEITRNRWMEEDPEGLLDHVRLRNWSNLTEIAQRWARQDPDRALGYLETSAPSKDKARLKMAMLGGLTESRPDLVLAAAAESIDGHNDYHWREIFKNLARHNPSALENAELPIAFQSSVRRAILTAALERDFDSEITRHLNSPEAFADIASALSDDYNLGRKISASLLSRLGSLPPELLEKLGNSAYSLVNDNPLAWLETDLSALGMNPATASRFQQAALGNLTHKNPEAVLGHLVQLEMDPDQSLHLAAQALIRLQATDPAKVADWQAHLIANASDADFASKLSAQMVQRENLKLDSAEAILAKFKSHTDPSNSWQLANSIQNASPTARREFEARLKSMDSHEVAAIAHQIDPSRLTPELQAPLLSAALQHPRETPEANGNRQSNPETAVINLATTWVQSDPTAASRWAASLPAGEARQWTLRNLAANWAPYDTPAANAWIAKLPAADQADVREFLKNGPPK